MKYNQVLITLCIFLSASRASFSMELSENNPELRKTIEEEIVNGFKAHLKMRDIMMQAALNPDASPEDKKGLQDLIRNKKPSNLLCNEIMDLAQHALITDIMHIANTDASFIPAEGDPENLKMVKTLLTQAAALNFQQWANRNPLLMPSDSDPIHEQAYKSGTNFILHRHSNAGNILAGVTAISALAICGTIIYIKTRR